MTALQIIKAKDAPQVISLVTHPVVPLPMRVDVIDQYGKTSTLTYSYCHSKNGSVMSQLKVYEDNQPVESLSATVAGDNICLFEHVFDEKLSILKVNIREKLEHIAFGKGKTYEKDSFEDYLNEALNGLPTFARFDRFARIIPDTIEVDKDVVRFLFADGSCVRWNPLDVYRVGVSKDDLLLCSITGPIICMAVIMIWLVTQCKNDEGMRLPAKALG